MSLESIFSSPEFAQYEVLWVYPKLKQQKKKASGYLIILYKDESGDMLV